MANKTRASKVKRFHVRRKDREYFTANLALLLKASVPVGETFQALKETSKSPQFHKALDQMRSDVDEGMSLWKVLERSGIVGSQTLAMVRLGEQSGNLSENLLLAAKQEEKQNAFRAKVRSALIYPVFVISLTLIVGIGVAWFLLPRLAVTFSQLNVKLPFISLIFIDFGIFLQKDGLWAVPMIACGAILVLYVLFAAPRTKFVGQTLLFHVPGISKLMHEIEIARYGYLLGTLLSTGLGVTEALQLLGEATTAVRYQRLYAHLRESFENGYSFKASFASYKGLSSLLPPAVQQMIIAGERSGELSQTLMNIASIYDEKADVSTQNLEAILEPILLVIVWLGVLGVAVAVILPIYSLVGGLSR